MTALPGDSNAAVEAVGLDAAAEAARKAAVDMRDAIRAAARIQTPNQAFRGNAG
jgi:hypothetical protein